MRWFLLACALGAGVPLLVGAPPPRQVAVPFPGWPQEFVGPEALEVELDPRESLFAEGFPGRVARFQSGHRELVLRWVTAGTRRLHPSADCFTAAGYEVTPMALIVDADHRVWSSFRAERGETRLMVRERIFTADVPSEGWADASSWFWAAALGRTDGPWWAVTIAEREPR